MLSYDFASRIRSGATVIGTWLTVPDVLVLEAMGKANFDFVQVDGEHGPAHPDTLHSLLPACERIGLPMIYRARRNRDDLVGAALDAGVAGIMVPMVNTPSDAAQTVAAAKYPPMGRRGFGPWRSSDYYRDGATQHVREANRTSIVAVQIEHAEAVANVEAIAATPGIDLLYVGPADLALSIGVPVGSTDEHINNAFERVAAAGLANGIAVGTDIGDLDHARWLHSIGYRYFTYGGDLTYLAAGSAESSARIRGVLGS